MGTSLAPWIANLAVGALAVAASAATLRVPSQYLTIQAAIDASSDGDSILVAAGQYEESLSVTTTLSILGDGPTSTRLQSSLYQGVEARSGADLLLSGFEVSTTGSATPGIVVAFASMRLRDCRIRGCDGGGQGGGLITGANTNIECTDVTFQENKGLVGGVSLQDGTARFIRCTFIGNEAEGTALAGAVALDGTDAEFLDCNFIGNRSTNGIGFVGGLYFLGLQRGSLTVRNCLFVENHGNKAGALRLSGGDATIDHCTLDSNVSAEQAAGIVALDFARASATNCIFSSNGPTAAMECLDGSQVVVDCSDLWNNGDDSVCVDGGSNFSLDPLFCGDEERHLQVASPCAEANNPTCGLVGARAVACVNPVDGVTWGQIKAITRGWRGMDHY